MAIKLANKGFEARVQPIFIKQLRRPTQLDRLPPHRRTAESAYQNDEFELRARTQLCIMHTYREPTSKPGVKAQRLGSSCFRLEGTNTRCGTTNSFPVLSCITFAGFAVWRARVCLFLAAAHQTIIDCAFAIDQCRNSSILCTHRAREKKIPTKSSKQEHSASLAALCSRKNPCEGEVASEKNGYS